MKKLFWIAVTVMFAAFNATSRAQTSNLVDSAYLDLLRAEVRTNHPTVAAAQARLSAAEAGVRAVRLWEDPMAGFSVMAADREIRRDDGDLMFMAEQMLPRRGLYKARKLKANAERGVFEAEKISAALDLEMLVAQAVVELALADETILVQSNQVAWLESMAVNARQKLIDPTGSSAEPLRVEGELAQERQRFDTAKRRRTALARQLNTTLGRPLDQPWPQLALPPQPADMARLETEFARLASSNPMLQALMNIESAAKAEVEVARQERKPIFSVGAESRVYSGGDFREAMIGAKMTLPWFNNSVYRSQTERARHHELAAQREYEALERKLRSAFVVAYTEAENAARQAEIFITEVIPRTEKASQAIDNAWISRNATLLEVLEARRSLLNARLEHRRSVAMQLATLETLRSIIPPALELQRP